MVSDKTVDMVLNEMMTLLKIFYHRIARRIVGMTAKKRNGGERGWVLVNAELKTTGIWPIR